MHSTKYLERQLFCSVELNFLKLYLVTMYFVYAFS